MPRILEIQDTRDVVTLKARHRDSLMKGSFYEVHNAILQDALVLDPSEKKTTFLQLTAMMSHLLENILQSSSGDSHHRLDATDRKPIPEKVQELENLLHPRMSHTEDQAGNHSTGRKQAAPHPR